MTNFKNVNYLILIAAISLSSMLFSNSSLQIFFFLFNKQTEYSYLFYFLFFIIFIYSFLFGIFNNLNFKNLFFNDYFFVNFKNIKKNFYIFFIIYFAVETVFYILSKDKDLFRVFVYLLIISLFFFCFSTFKFNLRQLSLFGKYFLNIFFIKCLILSLLNFNLQNLFLSYSSSVNFITFCSYVFIFFCKEDKIKIIYYSIIALLLFIFFKSKLCFLFFLFYVYFNFTFKGNKTNFLIIFYYIIVFFIFFIFFISYLLIDNFDVVSILNNDWLFFYKNLLYECGLIFTDPSNQYLFRLYSLTCNNLMGKIHLFFLGFNTILNDNLFINLLNNIIVSFLISIKERLILLVEFLNVIKNNKLLPNFYNIEYYNNLFLSDLAKNYYHLNIKINSHNSFVDVAYKMGLIGFLFIFYLFYSLYLSMKKKEVNVNVRFLILFFVCFMFLQDNMFKNNIIVSLFFWFVVSLTFNKQKI